MTDYASDQLLKKVLLDAVAEEYAAELNSTEKVTTSFSIKWSRCLPTQMRGPSAVNVHYGESVFILQQCLYWFVP